MSFWVLAVMPNPFLPQQCNVVYKEEQYNVVMVHFTYQVYSRFALQLSSCQSTFILATIVMMFMDVWVPCKSDISFTVLQAVLSVYVCAFIKKYQYTWHHIKIYKVTTAAWCIVNALDQQGDSEWSSWPTWRRLNLVVNCQLLLFNHRHGPM